MAHMRACWRWMPAVLAIGAELLHVQGAASDAPPLCGGGESCAAASGRAARQRAFQIASSSEYTSALQVSATVKAPAHKHKGMEASEPAGAPPTVHKTELAQTQRTHASVSLAQSSDKAVHSAAAGDPFPAGWFGDFDEAESTYTAEGLDASHADPKWSVLYGRDPVLNEPDNMEILPAHFFHESQSAGPRAAWQTAWPAVSGSVAGNRDVKSNPWRLTPEGWVQDYQTMQERDYAGPSHADWFDNSVHQVDGFGRRMTPNVKPPFDDGRYYARSADWEEKSVNTTITCKKPGCTAKSALQLYDSNTHEARNCRLTVAVHPTDYDDDWSREHVAYLKVNGWLITRQCNPRARGCNSTADRPLYPCINGFSIDSIVGKTGGLEVEAKNTQMVDECPYKGNLLSGVAMATCMVRKKVDLKIMKQATTTKPPFAMKPLHGEALLQCKEPGCAAETHVNFNPVLALNGGKCLLNVSVHQTDFDDHLGVPEQIDYIAIDGKHTSKKPIQPGKNPCNMRYAGKKVTHADEWFLAVKDHDVTELAIKSRPMGALHVTGKINENVDECAHDGHLFYAKVSVTCTPPKKFAAEPPSLDATKMNDDSPQNEPKK